MNTSTCDVMHVRVVCWCPPTPKPPHVSEHSHPKTSPTEVRTSECLPPAHTEATLVFSRCRTCQGAAAMIVGHGHVWMYGEMHTSFRLGQESSLPCPSCPHAPLPQLVTLPGGTITSVKSRRLETDAPRSGVGLKGASSGGVSAQSGLDDEQR